MCTLYELWIEWQGTRRISRTTFYRIHEKWWICVLCHLNMRVSDVCILYETQLFAILDFVSCILFLAKWYIQFACWIKKFEPLHLQMATLRTDCQFTDWLIHFGIHWENDWANICSKFEWISGKHTDAYTYTVITDSGRWITKCL